MSESEERIWLTNRRIGLLAAIGTLLIIGGTFAGFLYARPTSTTVATDRAKLEQALKERILRLDSANERVHTRLDLIQRNHDRRINCLETSLRHMSETQKEVKSKVGQIYNILLEEKKRRRR